MSAKRSNKVPLTDSAARIRAARKALKTMPRERKLDLMVQAGLLTEQQADLAKENLAKARLAAGEKVPGP